MCRTEAGIQQKDCRKTTYTYMYVTLSWCCTEEINTTLYINYMPIFFKSKQKDYRSSGLLMRAKLLQSCSTLCDPPGSSARGILQARILEWVAISYSSGSSQPRDRTHTSHVSCTGGWILYHQGHLGSLCYSSVHLGFEMF